jgi:NAD(P)-dependent dehydrogenase (short-subunit alcohol dehydrogenase family)
MILIIGASGGIGQYLAERYIEDGFEVCGTYNSNTKGICELDAFTQLDITNISDVEAWLDSISDKLDSITLINCVGINYNCFGHKSELESWKNVIEVNLIGSFNLIRSILPYMRQQKFGRIINLSSIVAQIGVHGTSAYAASKSGLWGMTRSLVKENAALGITLNNLNLGYFNAGMIDSVPKDYLNQMIENIPMKRLGKPSEIYQVTKMLMDVSYINGANIDINGGI